jgi:flagellar basal-body rod protein FlgC
MLEILDIGASGLTAQRTRMDAIASNVANVNTTRDANGNKIPYRRKFVTFMPGQSGDPARPGVHVGEIGEDKSDFQKRYEPGHPDADKEGYVRYPNIDLAFEMVNMMEATRAYEATVNLMDVSKAMFNASLRLIA